MRFWRLSTEGNRVDYAASREVMTRFSTLSSATTIIASIHLVGAFTSLSPRWRLRDLHVHKSNLVTESPTDLTTGLSMQTFRALPEQSTGLPALIFVHGSFHGGWCWAEHYLSFFAERGYPSYSVSLRGTSGSPTEAKSVAIGEHVNDLKSFIETTCDARRNASKPLVIAHSFGGVALMKLLEAHADIVGGAAFFCSVPPSGNGPMTQRFLSTRPIASLKIVLGFVAKLACSQPTLARELFFGDTLDDDEAALKRYMAAFTRDSKVGLDLKALSGALPSLSMSPDGTASWWQPDFAMPPVLVVGAELDFLVDKEGVAETSKFLGGAPFTMLPGTHHDIMLGKRWLFAASVLEDWLKRLD